MAHLSSQPLSSLSNEGKVKPCVHGQIAISYLTEVPNLECKLNILSQFMEE